MKLFALYKQRTIKTNRGVLRFTSFGKTVLVRAFEDVFLSYFSRNTPVPKVISFSWCVICKFEICCYFFFCKNQSVLKNGKANQFWWTFLPDTKQAIFSMLCEKVIYTFTTNIYVQYKNTLTRLSAIKEAYFYCDCLICRRKPFNNTCSARQLCLSFLRYV